MTDAQDIVNAFNTEAVCLNNISDSLEGVANRMWGAVPEECGEKEPEECGDSMESQLQCARDRLLKARERIDRAAKRFERLA